MPANNLVCKFNASHGTFVTPVKLSEHYRAEHADVWVGNPPNVRQYRCRLCGGEYRNPSTHVRQIHPDQLANRPYVGRVVDRIEDSTTQPQGRRALDRAARVNGVDVVHEPANAAPRHVGPWTVDDIVLPVVEQLAQPRGLVPVDVLAAIFVWRDATAAMLTAVTSRNR